MASSNDRRVFFLGVNTGYVTDGEPDARYIEFYRRRSSSQLHCVIIGNVVVPGGHPSNASTPVLTEKDIWKTVAEVIGAGGCLPGIQLATAWQGYEGTRKFVGADPRQIIAASRRLVQAFDARQTHMVLDAFDNAAKVAVVHGFKHVQIHCAHGYLLGLMIDQRINPRADMVLDRLRSLANWLASMGIESSIRISLRTGDAAFDAEGAAEFQDCVSSLTFDYVDLSSGFYNIDKRLIYPSRPEFLAARLEESCAVATRLPEQAFIMSGRAMQNTANSLPANLHIGLCRDLIANPQYLNETHNGCQNRNKCHYFSRGMADLTCALWLESDP